MTFKKQLKAAKILLELLSPNLPSNLFRNSISSSNTLLIELTWFVITLSLKRSSLWSGLCVSHFLLIVSGFVTWEKLAHKDVAHLFSKLQTLEWSNHQFCQIVKCKMAFVKLVSFLSCKFFSWKNIWENREKIRNV